MKIGVIGAMDVEVADLTSKVSDPTVTEIAGLKFVSGRIADTQTVIVRCGVGKVNAAVCAQILIDRFEVTHIINSGIAGSLNSAIDIGDLVVSTDAVQHDFDACLFGYQPGQIPGRSSAVYKADETLRRIVCEAIRTTAPEISVFEGRIASGDQFISQGDRKAWIRKTFQAECTEMEGAAIAHTAWANGIPFVIMRYISDKADESASVAYPEFEEQAARHSADLIYRVLSTGFQEA